MPLIGQIALLVFICSPSTPGANRLVFTDRHHLEKEIKAIEDKLLKRIKNNGRLLKPEELRIAKSFAFIAAAGMSAAREKLIQVNRKEVLRCTLFLFQKAVAETNFPEEILLNKDQGISTICS